MTENPLMEMERQTHLPTHLPTQFQSQTQTLKLSPYPAYVRVLIILASVNDN
ncbi:MAG: hypothetical protein HN745_28675 [Deltaproteobacteria bacterium]|nr:hypothetical protein [Deltaproteobacteria bacterium]